MVGAINEHVTRSSLLTMVKSGSPSPVGPYRIVETDFPLLTFEEARALPLPPTRPELIRDNTRSTHNYTPQLPPDEPLLLQALAKLRKMAAFPKDDEDVDR